MYVDLKFSKASIKVDLNTLACSYTLLMISLHADTPSVYPV